jgi:hypothetical protein
MNFSPVLPSRAECTQVFVHKSVVIFSYFVLSVAKTKAKIQGDCKVAAHLREQCVAIYGSKSLQQWWSRRLSLRSVHTTYNSYCNSYCKH